MSIQGCDISGWQAASVNYGAMQFVYSKITQGTYISNPNHDAQVAEARAAGLIVGHYHFPAWGDPRAEAQAFWSAAKAQPGDFLVLDIEDSAYTPWPADPVSWCCAFEDALHELSGIWAMDYAGPNVRFHPGWDWAPLAQRGGALIDPEYNPVGPGSPAPWAAVAMWQNADTNVTGGDSDIFYGDRAALTSYGIPGITPQGVTDMPITDDDAIKIANTLLRFQVDKDGGGKAMLLDIIASYNAVTDAQVGKIANAVLDAPITNVKTGKPTTIRAEIGWGPENFQLVIDAVKADHSGPVAPAGTGTTSITPADIDAIVARLKTELPPALRADLAAKLAQ